MMRAIIKGKWLIIFLWGVVVSLLLTSAPNMADLVREKGQLTIPDGYSSKTAQELLSQMDENGTEQTASIVLVFHNEKTLTEKDFQEAKKAVQRLENNQEKLGIVEILTHFHDEQLRDQLVSSDGKTILVPLTIDLKDRTVKELRDDLYNEIADIQLEHYYTGRIFIDEDVILSSEAGLKKTEIITVFFILMVLILVYRSFVSPFIPLITVGISYLVSLGIVSYLVKYVDFPLSNFTQIFLVAVLFGIGTDYSILLLSRFKEELIKQENLTDAIVETYRHAGKTVFFSGIAVLIAFSVIGLSQFSLYQSAVAVAVGIAVLLLALFTIVPFFMAVLGKKIFWPQKGSLEHKPSKLWTYAGTFTFLRPVVSLLIVAIITIPFIFMHKGNLSYNMLNEIGPGYRSVKGFDIISESFSPGESMPTQIVLKNDDQMDQPEYIALIEKISQELEKVDGVEKVRSVTRPTGEFIEDLLVAKQAGKLKDGIQEGNDGIKQISDGLNEAGKKITSSKPELVKATKGIDSLISGTSELQSGIGELQNGLRQIETGIRNGAMGAAELQTGLTKLKGNAEKILAGYKQLEAGYTEAETYLIDMQQIVDEGTIAFQENIGLLEETITQVEDYVQKQQPSMEKEVALQIIAKIKNDLPDIANEMMVLNKKLNNAVDGYITANQNFRKLNKSQEQLIAGLNEFINGIEKLQQGLTKAADGQETVIKKLPEVDQGLGRVNDGQRQLLKGFGDLSQQLDQLSHGLNQSVEGLTQVHDGLHEATTYLSDLASSPTYTGIFISDEVLKNEEFKKVLDTYFSKDRKITVIDVIFAQNPYSQKSIDTVDDLKEVVQLSVKDTKLENAKVAIGGVSSIYHDLDHISKEDYSRTMILMLIGIGLILIILFRSLIMPIYILISLLITYYTTMGITESIFTKLLGYDGLSWAVPFFSFVILIALGVDYSIFLMGRFNEYRGEPIDKAMILSMSNMGTVIISAAIILGGTFAAMYPSGVLSLLQIATVVITGLMLYALVILPLFVPVMVKIFGRANWWPFVADK